MPDYCEQSDLEAIYGAGNVAKWADLDNTQNPVTIAARIAWAITLATDDFNTRLRGGVCVPPFTAPYDACLVSAVARHAGMLLYESRGVTDDEGQTLSAMNKDKTDTFIREVRTGRRRLSGTINGSMVPHSMTDYDEKFYRRDSTLRCCTTCGCDPCCCGG